MRRTISVFEHEKLGIQPNVRGEYLTNTELKKLLEFNDLNGNKYFSGIRDGVKFKSFVGVLRVGNLTLEILPKADLETHTTETEKKWKGVLLQMLAVCKKINVNIASEASLKKRSFSILDMYFEMFLNELEALVAKGLIKKYHKIEGNSQSLKGRILFSKHINQNLVRQDRFYTEHQTYDPNHSLNQILHETLLIIKTLVNNSSLADKTGRILLNFPEYQRKKYKEVDFDRIKFGRKTESYRSAIKIAKIIILNYSPTIDKGNNDLLALLFDMDRLWEEYIYRSLANSIPKEFDISPQKPAKFWENRTIRPDIVLHNKQSKQNLIFDTKWKLIKDNKPSDEDLRQMFAYNVYWDAQKSYLVYPASTGSNIFLGKFHKGQINSHGCGLMFLDIFEKDRKRINRNLGNMIHKYLL
jgi:5-methylcytosine-specific restriction enzyme subunit McrC